MSRPSILLVDDDDILRNRLTRALASRGFDVYSAKTKEDAISQAEEAQPERAVLDLKMPETSGIEILKELLRVSPLTQTVILTGYGSITNAVEAVRLGAINYLTKPADADEILAAFENHATETPTSDPQNYNPQSLAEAEWEHIHRVLNDCGGNLSEAARLLDIPRRTLQRKLKKLAP
ncbi:response regulator transcription factor [Blastopirellula marina]|uniref:DNA-binding response regulator n=1 Tax=Blastopirellula marina TaxID=124 RepID=A0A2S8G1U7_9BACT|nr:response regulator [Blastopirellula marina]PQO38416.1 DNA-binding response regulator [Blastopirellula marina]PTL45073.1 DNA-binding response regulator [Blastopirellula marina]